MSCRPIASRCTSSAACPRPPRPALAFQSQGPAGLPPGTQRTFLEMIPFGDRVRRNGRLETTRARRAYPSDRLWSRPAAGDRLPLGAVFTAYHSTGIPNIVDYAVLPIAVRRQMAAMTMLRPLFRLKAIRTLAGRGVKPGPTAGERAQTVTHVWGEVRDDRGRTAVSRLHGPEAGVEWTARAALAAVRRIADGDTSPGFRTPALAFGADFVLEADGVTREDLDDPAAAAVCVGFIAIRIDAAGLAAADWVGRRLAAPTGALPWTLARPWRPNPAGRVPRQRQCRPLPWAARVC